MSFIKRMLKQTATWWDLSSTPYDQYGDPSFSAPIILDPADGAGVRWEDKVQEFINKTGERDFGRAVVWSQTTAFAVGDYLYLGTSVATNPETVTGSDRVKYVEKIYDIKAQAFLYKALL